MSEGQANGPTGTADVGDGAGPDTVVLGPAQPQGAGQHRSERPEIAVGAAFAGGFLLALLLRRARS